MFIVKPQDRLKLVNSESEYLLEMYSDISKFYWKNKDVQLTAEQYEEARDIINESTELGLSTDHVKSILDLYPTARIRFAVDHERENLFFAISHFFLGCTWPTYGDKVNMDDFIALLNTQARKFFPEISPS